MSAPSLNFIPIGLNRSAKKSIVTELLIWGTGIFLIALCAQIAIPWHPVPVTLQTLGIMLVGLGVGFKRGAAISIGYVALGALGLPIFNHFSGGISYLWGSTGGYLLGMPIAASLLGFWAEKGWDRTPWKLAIGILCAEAIILGLGVIVLSGSIGEAKAIELGLDPFLAIELAKVIIVSLALPAIWQLRNRLKP